MLADRKGEVILLDMLVQLRNGLKFSMIHIRLFEDTKRAVGGLGCLEMREIVGASLLACVGHEKLMYMLYCGFPTREDAATRWTGVGGSKQAS
jgi:hypothetical protein